MTPCKDSESPSSSKSSDLTPHRVVKLVPCNEDAEVDILGGNSDVELLPKSRRKRQYPKLSTSNVKTWKKRKNLAARRATTSNRRAASRSNLTTTRKQVDERHCVAVSTASDSTDVQRLGVRASERHATKDSQLHVKDWSICASPLPVETIADGVDNSESDMCSIASVEDNGTHKTVTIKWRGRKIKIFKEIDRSKHSCAKMHRCGDSTSKMSLVMEVDEGTSTETVTSATTRSASNSRLTSSVTDADDDLPPHLVPVDVDVSLRVTPQNRRLQRDKRVRSVPAKLSSSSSSMSDVSDSEGPPVLSPIVPYWDSRRVEPSRMTRSMDKMQRYKTRMCASDYFESLKSSVHTLRSAHAKRSLEKSFMHSTCRLALPPSGKKRKPNDVDSESVLSCSNSIISVSSNGEEETANCDDDCQIYEPSSCIIVSEKTADRVSLSARIDIGSPFTRNSVDTRAFRTSLASHEPDVIDLTDS